MHCGFKNTKKPYKVRKKSLQHVYRCGIVHTGCYTTYVAVIPQDNCAVGINENYYIGVVYPFEGILLLFLLCRSLREGGQCCQKKQNQKIRREL